MAVDNDIELSVVKGHVPVVRHLPKVDPQGKKGLSAQRYIWRIALCGGSVFAGVSQRQQEFSPAGINVEQLHTGGEIALNDLPIIPRRCFLIIAAGKVGEIPAADVGLSLRLFPKRFPLLYIHRLPNPFLDIFAIIS